MISIPRDKIVFTLTCEQDFTTDMENELADCTCPKDLEILRERLKRGDDWAWAEVTVTATYGDFTGMAHLGGCSYDSEEDFRDGGYLEAMEDDAMYDLLQNVSRFLERAAKLMVDLALG